MENNILKFNENPLTIYQNLQAQKKQIIEQIISGDYDSIDMELTLKVFEDFIKDIRDYSKKNAKKDIRERTSKYGFVIEPQSRSTWNYDSYSEYAVKKDELKDIEEKMKLAYKGATVINEDGEIIPPASKNTVEFLKITYPK